MRQHGHHHGTSLFCRAMIELGHFGADEVARAQLAQTCGDLVWDRRVSGSTVRKERAFWHATCTGFWAVGLARRENNFMTYVMTKPCPICKQQLTKKLPTDVLQCPCG